MAALEIKLPAIRINDWFGIFLFKILGMDSTKWEDQVAIVTGAGQGIGLEIAKRLARKGVAVLLNDLDAVMAEDSAKIITEEGGRCVAHGGDSSSPETVQAMVDLAVKTYGRLTMAIANAGIT